MKIDDHAPYADGILFDDIHGWPSEAVNFLAARCLLYSTEFTHDGRTFCGHVVASDGHKAQTIAFGRGLGERVTGRVIEVGRV